MELAPVTLADWRAQVEKELAGKSFERVLVNDTLEGLSIQPLYTEAPTYVPAREAPEQTFRICMRQNPGAAVEDVVADVAGGADSVWMRAGETFDGAAKAVGKAVHWMVDTEALTPGPSPRDGRGELSETFLESLRIATRAAPPPSPLGGEGPGERAPVRVAHATEHGPGVRASLTLDPIGQRAASGGLYAEIPADLLRLATTAKSLDASVPNATSVIVSTLAYHDAGADAAEELAIALSTGARYLDSLLEGGLSLERAAKQIALQIAVGADVFLELCKVRALRVCWEKLLVAAGLSPPSHTLVHAVCSSRTLAARDPWVNMLRVTTQVFSAVLGGADLVTPSSFDQALGLPSAHGRRVARNTGLVLREESFLGKVADPAGGSYYIETLTDSLAREAWKRFQGLEREGGIVEALSSGRLLGKLDATWKARLERITKRKTPILGVSEFANLDETLPLASGETNRVAKEQGALPEHRDAEVFEELRTRSESLATRPEVLLVTLGTLAETRPRVGFSAGFFAAGGVRTRETEKDEAVAVACLCGTDERYGLEAVARVKALKAAGVGRVLMAGKPGALEPALRDAGVDGFIFVGCDVVGILTELLGGLS